MYTASVWSLGLSLGLRLGAGGYIQPYADVPSPPVAR